MLAGIFIDGPAGDALFRHGVLQEVSFCILDLFNLYARRYPYEEQRAPILVVLVLLHHLPFPAYLLANECCVSPGTKRIGISLLGAGTLSIAAVGVQYIFDATTQTGRIQQLVMHMINFIFYLYTRFYVFPTEFWALWAKRDPLQLGLNILAAAFFGMMGLFNCAGFLLLVEKQFKIVRSIAFPRRYKPE